MDLKQTMYAIGESIRSKREEKGLSRKQVQELIDVSQQYIGEIERGEGNPSLEILIKLAEIYNVTIAELIGDPTLYNNKINNLFKKMKFTEKQEILRLLNAFEKLNKDEINSIIKLIYEFKK